MFSQKKKKKIVPLQLQMDDSFGYKLTPKKNFKMKLVFFFLIIIILNAWSMSLSTRMLTKFGEKYVRKN